MDGGREIPNIPARPDEGEPGIRVGVDDWVATHEQRHEHRGGPFGRIQRELERAPRPAFYAAFGIAAALLPAFTSNGYIIRVGFDTLIYMLLCLGLNVVVGYAGLLDLGYVAFYGTRRLHLRHARLAASSGCTGTRSSSSRSRSSSRGSSASSSRCRRGG